MTGYEVRRFPLERLPQVEMLGTYAGRPTMHGLFEVDVTRPRGLIRTEAERTGERISFTAFLVGCLAKAVDEHKEVQALRRYFRRLVVFDEVDVATLIEVDAGGVRVPMFHVVRDAANKSLIQIHEDIREAQERKAGLDPRRRQIRRVGWIPKPVRAVVWRVLGRSPKTWKKNGGTVVLTSVGMFADGMGWGFSTAGGHPVSVTAGGIGPRPVLVDGRVEEREFLSLAVTFDHTVVDGAPAARFAARLKSLVESGWGLPGTSL